MSLAVAAAALDRALKGTASTMPPHREPPPLYSHQKSLSTNRENSSYIRATPPGQFRVHNYGGRSRPLQRIKTDRASSGYRVNSETRARNNYASSSGCENAATSPFQEKRNAEIRRSSNLSFGKSYKNGFRQRNRIEEFTESTDKFYSIPRFPFRQGSFHERILHEDYKRNYFFHSHAYENRFREQWKPDSLNSRKGLYASSVYETERKYGPTLFPSRSFTTSTRRNNFSSVERRKVEEKSKFSNEPTCSSLIHKKQPENKLEAARDPKAAKSGKCFGYEKTSPENLGIESSREARRNLVTGGLRTPADKPEFKTRNDRTGSVKPEAEVSWQNSSSKQNNVAASENKFSESRGVKGSVAESSGKETDQFCKNSTSTNELETNLGISTGSQQQACSLKCASRDLHNEDNGSEVNTPIQHGKCQLIASCRKQSLNNPPAEGLKCKSAYEERNANTLADVAEVTDESFSNRDAIEEDCKTDRCNTDGATGLKIQDEVCSALFKKDEQRNLHKAQTNLMFDFMYHSESEGFRSSSPIKIDRPTRRDFQEDEFEKKALPEKCTRNKTESILASIKSSRRKLLESSISKSNALENPSLDSKPQTYELPNFKERSDFDGKREIETPKSPCENKIIENSSGLEMKKQSVKCIENTGASEPCVVSVALSEVMPSVATRWRSVESAPASNFKEEFHGYHSCEKFHSQESKYKTELCRAFQIRGTCRYGSRCNYAHGLDQLKVSFHHGKYKTRNCQAYHESGYCRYGARCSFIHDLEEGILKCSIANKEILEALHHWPEEESSVDRSATVTWRVFTGCSNNDLNETMLEFTAIPSLKPADIHVDLHQSSTNSFDTETPPGVSLYDAQEEVSRSGGSSTFGLPEQESLFPKERCEPRDLPRVMDGPCTDSIQKSIYVSDFSCEQDEYQGNRSSLTNVHDILDLLRSVETERFSIHRSCSPSNRVLHQPREMRIVSRLPCSRQNELMNRHDFYKYRTRISRQKRDVINCVEDDLDDCKSSKVVMKKKCTSFHHQGFCLFGPNCLFVHDE